MCLPIIDTLVHSFLIHSSLIKHSFLAKPPRPGFPTVTTNSFRPQAGGAKMLPCVSEFLFREVGGGITPNWRSRDQTQELAPHCRGYVPTASHTTLVFVDQPRERARVIFGRSLGLRGGARTWRRWERIRRTTRVPPAPHQGRLDSLALGAATLGGVRTSQRPRLGQGSPVHTLSPAPLADFH